VNDLLSKDRPDAEDNTTSLDFRDRIGGKAAI